MKNIKNITIAILALVVSVSLYSFRLVPPPAGVSIVVIVNKDNPVASLTAGEVKLYWMRKIKTRWPNINKNIRPVDHKTKCSEQETFYWKVLGMTSDEVETYFVTKQYQNAQKPQDKFASDREIVDFVGEEVGAIGFINAANLTPEAKSKVKVVFTLSN